MKNLNTTLFDLDNVFTTMSHGETWSKIIDLKIVRDELVDLREEFIQEVTEFDEYVDDILDIDTQLIFLNKNIRTFENALLAHESKVLEKRLSLGDLGTICLN